MTNSYKIIHTIVIKLYKLYPYVLVAGLEAGIISLASVR